MDFFVDRRGGEGMGVPDSLDSRNLGHQDLATRDTVFRADKREV